MIPSLSVRALWRMIVLIGIATSLLVGCGSDDEPAPANDASVDISREGAAGAGGADASGPDLGADSTGNVEAGSGDAMIDRSTTDAVNTIDATDAGPADAGPADVATTDRVSSTDAEAGDAADAVETADVDTGDVADTAVQVDASDASSEAIPDAGAADVADGSTSDGGTIPITSGGTYGSYVVESITLAAAPSGTYTFHVTGPTAGSVELRRDGTPVTTLSYIWQTTVSATNPEMFYTFDFVGYFSIVIRKAGSGTINLYAMDQSIFDGAHALTVIADGGTGG